MARLDRLMPVKEVAQVGSVLGREFSYEMLRAVAPMTAVELDDALQRLTEAGLVFRRGTPPVANYTFKHALIQDAAYESLLKSSRQQLHEKIARVLHSRFPTIRDVKPELLAHHYTEGGLRDVAVPLWYAAGKNAVARSANVEAIGHLNKGLEVLKSLPYCAEHDRQELLLETLLGNALMATRGYGAPEVGRTFDRARALCERLGETPQLFPVLRGLWMFYLVRSDLRTARQLAEQIMQLAERVQEPSVLLEAHRSVGMTLFFSGEFRFARQHLEKGIALYDPQQHREHAFLYGTDPGVACLCYLAATLWIMGFADQAIERLHEGLFLADKCSHSFSRSFALFFAAMIYQYRRDAISAQKQAEIDIALSKEEGFVLWLAMATIVRGWTRADQGRKRDGLTEMREGLGAYRATGARLAHTYIFSLLGEICGRAGHFDEGLSVLTEALTTSADSGESVFEAELYRLKAELILQSRWSIRRRGNHGAVSTARESIEVEMMGDEREPEAYFSKAMDIARVQEAKSFQLRAAIGLCRLWQMKGKGDEARRLLGDLYACFTEGLDTPDLQDARRLLDDLC
jgi:predicted ATPase